MTAILEDLKQQISANVANRPRYTPVNHRRILCVFPAYSPSFGTFDNAYPLLGVKAFMPPQGILVAAAYLPQEWDVRFIDENIRSARPIDYQWADVVIVSGMHIQRPQINRINDIAHSYNKMTVLGGPSVSGCPEYYPNFDLLHLGELGDQMDALIIYIDQHTDRPPHQLRFETKERLPLHQFPLPAYHLVNLDNYLLGSLQYSSGCPYRCEFCDIPELYGRTPRLKEPEQIIAELDAMLDRGNVGAIYFVDDNFVGDRHAAIKLLPYLIDWQKRRGYPVQFACEATLNLAQNRELLAMMREAYFCTVFCGIETPEKEALRSIGKQQNLMGNLSILDAIKTLNSYGMEVVSGIILGLDTDNEDTSDRILEFIRTSNIPLLTINLLYALPKTPLWRRLEEEGRLNFDESRESNAEFRLPYDRVIAMWRQIITQAYEPEFLYERFAYNVSHTYVNRIQRPLSPALLSWQNIKRGLRILFSILLQVGVLSNYRQIFWKMAVSKLKAGEIESVIHIGSVAHHLITFARECSQGKQSASFYSQRLKTK